MEINGHPNYLVYEDGRVFSKKSRKILKPYTNGQGYMRVKLTNQKDMYIHRLVALHYIPNPHNYPEVDHIDRNRTNNDISNLRWADHSMNQQNTGFRCNNISGHKNISPHQKGGYVFQKTFRGKNHKKYFKTLEEAIEYKNAFDIKK